LTKKTKLLLLGLAALLYFWRTPLRDTVLLRIGPQLKRLRGGRRTDSAGAAQG